MKFRSVHKWQNVSNSRKLLFFAQLIDELLFEFSLDTYKPSAMNASVLCLEALTTISDIRNGVIAEPNLQHILDELHGEISKDEIAKSLISLDLSYIYERLKSKAFVFEEKKVIVEMLAFQLELNTYKKRAEEFLADEIFSEEVDFGKLRRFTRSYITTLINVGFHTKFINKVSQDFFYYGSDSIEGNQDVINYFSIFLKDRGPFSVVFKAGSGFLAVNHACTVFGLDLIESYSELEVPFEEETLKLNNDEIYIVLSGVKAMDKFSARINAEKMIDQMITVHSLFHHKALLELSSECIVYDTSEDESSLSGSPINTMHKCRDSKPTIAAKKMNEFVPGFSMEEASFLKFHRAAELHSMSLESRFKENQLINLWIALESIVPAKWEGRDISKIKHLINQVIPVLTVCYVDRLVDNLLKDLVKQSRRAVTVAVSGVSGERLSEKLIKVIALDEYVAKRNQLGYSFRDYYLLRDRFDFFVALFTSPMAVFELLENHSKRVSWQIRRIYRARNMMVHSGVTPTYTDILIENIHDYLDVIMKTIMHLTSENKKITTISQGFVYCDIQYAALRNFLSKKDSVFDHGNITKLVGNPLAI